MFASQMCAPGLKDAKKHENVEAVWDKATADMEKLDTGKYKFGKVKHHFFFQTQDYPVLGLSRATSMGFSYRRRTKIRYAFQRLFF